MRSAWINRAAVSLWFALWIVSDLAHSPALASRGWPHIALPLPHLLDGHRMFSSVPTRVMTTAYDPVESPGMERSISELVQTPIVGWKESLVQFSSMGNQDYLNYLCWENKDRVRELLVHEYDLSATTAGEKTREIPCHGSGAR